MTEPATDTGRPFSIGQVLTLACGNTEAQQVFCTYGELLEVLGYMLADVPLAEDIPAAIQRSRAAVHSQYPRLALLQPPSVTASDTAVLAWIAAQEREHGPTLALEPIEVPR